MGKIIDITEQLNFEEKPKLRIKKQLLEVNDSATTTLKLMEIMSDNDGTPNGKQLNDMYKALFSSEDRKKIEKLNLNMHDFTALVNAAVDLIVGESEPGE